ncbi:MAG TPA: DNA methyltransferase [Stellaceae bacterium]|nr:DNA methyltransferase [Stellaceae bacterium]
MRTRALNEAGALYRGFLDRLRAFRVLDPACGSGNFLYLALLALKDIEHRVAIEAESLGLPREFPRIGPEGVKGIEINPYAAELARVTVWIGEIQWMRRNGFDVGRNPILKPLDTIECRDAILNEDGSEADWPRADVVIGNPPFLGAHSLIGTLGESPTAVLRDLFSGRLTGNCDFVVYWFEKATELLAAEKILRFGLVATQSIRRPANREPLQRRWNGIQLFEAWSDIPWTADGADVRVSIICARRILRSQDLQLDGRIVPRINIDLTSDTISLVDAKRLTENNGVAFEGTKKYGDFDIDGGSARKLLSEPVNPNGRPNADVVKPWLNGEAVVSRNPDKWIIDFGCVMSEREAALYQEPFAYAERAVKPYRMTVRRDRTRRLWWRHEECRPGLRRAIAGLIRFIVSPRVAKHRIFAWAESSVLPDTRLAVIARDDDTMFGILHSRFHEAWSLRKGGMHGVGNDPQYTPSTGFETFPFPEGLTPNLPAEEYADDTRAVAIAAAARRLDELRQAWLNPADLVERVPEVVAGFPDRIVPVSEKAAAILKKRTLTNLYNERPAWLDNIHRALDAAVAAAYGWPADIGESEALGRLLDLNRERAAAGR